MTFASAAAQSSSKAKNPPALSLPSSWTVWFLIRHGRGAVQAANYENNIHPVATVSTAEEFWAVYGHMKRPRDLPINSDYQIFRTGIKPVWEDEANSNGGKWIFRLRKGLGTRLWEHLILTLLSGIFEKDGVCGVVYSVRYAEDIISIWNRTSQDEEEKNRLRDQLKAVLCLPPSALFEYKAHDLAMKDSSSFRNTDKFAA